MPSPTRLPAPFRRAVDTRSRVNRGANTRARGGAFVFTPGWEDLLAPQVLDDMEELARVGHAEMERLVPKDRGDVEGGLGATVDARDGSVYLYADHWDARFSEYGAGYRGAATVDSRGAGDFPGDYRPDYSGKPGRPAQPFVRPAALAAVEQVFG